jgi:hypothetical protein
MGRAQGLVEAAAGSPGNIALAKSNAAKTLRLLFRQLGWEVEVGWQGGDGGAADAQANPR